MSPEQATAEPRIDGRSDQYALGCVLYEMLAGAPPFTGPTSQSIMARHTADPVPPLRTVRDVPPALESAITKALAKMPADRWTDTTAFANSLESATRNTDVRPVTAPRRRLVPIVGAAVVILAAVVGYRLASRETTSIDAAPDSLRSVALQRFRFSGDTTFFWVAETFAEGLYPGLTKVAGIRVKPATNSQETYDDAFEFGRLLGVDAVITGDVQVRSNLLRVSAWLTNVADSALRSLGNFYGELQVNGAPRDIYRITDSIAVEIVAALKPNLSPERRAVAERGQRTTLLQALVLYQRARAEAGVDRTGASWERARELAEQAVRLDPNFSDAIVFLHQATVASMTIAGRTPTQAAQAVDGLLDRAIRADSLNGYAYAVRANFRAMFRREWNESLADFRKALELSPSSPDVLIDFAFAMTDRDQPDSALYYMRKAFDLVSVDAGVLHDLAMTLYFNGYPDSAYKAASVALTMNPGWTNYLVLMHSLLDKGRVAEADSMAEKYLAVGYQSTQALAYAAFYFMRSGNAKRARAMADSIFAHARRKYVPASEVATAYLAIGDTTKALDAIERADRQRDIMLANNLWFTLSPLAGNPRYERVVRAVFGDRPVRRTFSSSQR
jgi:serine/threonine-protein kinase